MKPPATQIGSITKEIYEFWMMQKNYLSDDPESRALIYVQTGEQMKEVYRVLAEYKVHALVYYGSQVGEGLQSGMDDEQRGRVLKTWISGEQGEFLIATSALGAGFHYSSVACVFHVGLPDGAVALIQQGSRGGRDGNPSFSVTWPLVSDNHR